MPDTYIYKERSEAASGYTDFFLFLIFFLIESVEHNSEASITG